MSEKKGSFPLQCESAENVLRLLDPLKSTPAGTVIFRQVSQVLNEVEYTQEKICRGYAAVLHTLLSVFRKQLPKDSLLYLELKLVQKRLQPPITLRELGALQIYINKVGTLMGKVVEPDTDLLREALAPLLNEYSGGQLIQESPQDQSGQLPQEYQPARQTPQPSVEPVENDNLSASAEMRLSSIYRQRLDQQRQDFEDLQNKLASKVFETVRQQEKFGLLIEVVLQNLKQANTKDELEEVRYHAVQEMEKMHAAQSLLVSMLNDTQAFLNLVRKNSEKLSEELKQVRVLSLTDDLTDLPNRRAYLRRLEDEIGRAKRYDSPLSVAILDLDNFKEINDNYGHAVGDEMLKLYSSEILSIFRHHDMVSRYGGEEFAVVLPNTSKEGAIRALEKVRTRVVESRLVKGALDLPAPTFSAGVAIYEYGESAESMLQRADSMLYLAKRKGRDCVEVADGPRVEEILHREKNEYS